MSDFTNPFPGDYYRQSKAFLRHGLISLVGLAVCGIATCYHIQDKTAQATIDRDQISRYGAAISAFYAYCQANPQSFKFIPPSQAQSCVLTQTVLLKNDRGQILARYLIASGEIIDVYV